MHRPFRSEHSGFMVINVKNRFWIVTLIAVKYMLMIHHKRWHNIKNIILFSYQKVSCKLWVLWTVINHQSMPWQRYAFDIVSLMINPVGTDFFFFHLCQYLVTYSEPIGSTVSIQCKWRYNSYALLSQRDGFKFPKDSKSLCGSFLH